MTDIDNNDVFSDPHAELCARIYRGLEGNDRFARQLTTSLGMCCPFEVRAVQHRRLPPPSPPEGCRALPIHDGLTAWLGKTVPAPPPPLICGPAETVPHPEALLDQLQQAIIAMRQAELRELKQQNSQTYVTPEDEVRLIQLTVQELRHRPDQAEAAVETCCRVLMLRHDYALNSARQRLLELLAATTFNLCSEPPFCHAYIDTVERVLSTYALGEFIEWFPHRLVELAREADRQRRSTRSSLIGEALNYIDHRFAGPMGLTQVAEALHVSKEHLAREFKRETGETVVTALNRLRLDVAKAKLASARAPLKTIAAACGFGSLEHFQRLFKRHVGVAPGAYRRQCHPPVRDPSDAPLFTQSDLKACGIPSHTKGDRSATVSARCAFSRR